MERLGGNFQIYENSGYRNERRKKQSLVIDLQDVGGSSPKFDTGNINFTTELQEPFIIDSLCDVYLDNFTTLDALQNMADPKNVAFVVDIDQFPIQTNTNNSNLFNKLVIPNEDVSASATTALKVHKGRKMNYVCQMNPQTLRQLSGSVRAMDGSGTMEDNNDKYRVIMEFVFVSRE
jgi:hypothetical protein